MSTTTKFTPGPWSRNKYGTLIDSVGQSVHLRSVSIACSGSHVAEAEANTDLISAAPELLVALQNAKNLLECVDTTSRNNFSNLAAEELDSINAAINKAIGAA